MEFIALVFKNVPYFQQILFRLQNSFISPYISCRLIPAFDVTPAPLITFVERVLYKPNTLLLLLLKRYFKGVNGKILCVGDARFLNNGMKRNIKYPRQNRCDIVGGRGSGQSS
jgi:hypothetical protein